MSQNKSKRSNTPAAKRSFSKDPNKKFVPNADAAAPTTEAAPAPHTETVDNAQSVIRSIQQTIQERGLEVTPPNVFACLITMLQSAPQPVLLRPILALLRAYAFRVSGAMVKAKSVTITKCIEQALRQHTDESDIVKRCFRLLGAVYRFVDITDEVFTRLRRLEPHHQNVVLLPGYLSILQSIATRCSEEHKADCVQFCDPILRYVISTMVSTSESVSTKAATTACNVITVALNDDVLRQQDLVAQLLGAVVECMEVHHRDRWNLSLQVLGRFFEIISQCKSNGIGISDNLREIIDRVFGKLVDMHEVDHGSLTNVVEKCMRSVAACLGAEQVLRHVPVTLDPAIAFRNKYILDVLRKSVSHDSLGFFATKLAPLANKMLQLSKDADVTSRIAESRQWQSVYEKMWELAQAFFRYPHDFCDALFRQIAKPLVEFLEDSFMRRISAKALATIAACATVSTSDEAHEAWAASARTVLQKYTKNILPKLCNLHERERLDYVGAAIRSFARVSEPTVLSNIAAAISRNLKETTDEEHMQALIHVAVCIASCLPQDVAEEWADLTSKSLEAATLAPQLEKQYYHLLSELARGGVISIACKQRLSQFLMRTQTTVHSPSRKFRIALMNEMIISCPREHLHVLAEAFTPEVIVCIKESSTRTREGALRVVQTLSKTMGAVDYLRILQVGLGGQSPLVLSGTLIAVAKLFWLHHRILPGEVHAFVKTITVAFMRHPALEVRNSAFSMLRMLIKVSFRDDTVATLLKGDLATLTATCFHWVSGTKVSSSTRQVMRVLVEKLYKRFGEQMVMAAMPAEGQRYANYVSKMMARRENADKAHEKSAEDEAAKFGKYFFGDSKSGVVLREDDEDAVDLAEPEIIRNLTTVRTRGREVEALKDDIDDDEEFNVLVDKEGKIVVAPRTPRRTRPAPDRLGGSSEKRRREDDDVGGDDDGGREDRQGVAQKGTVPSLMRRMLRVKRTKVVENAAPVRTGEQYKATSAGGDVRRNNGPDPYAYMPLDRKFLNKRHTRQGQERIKAISNTQRK
eukprot:PhM_4_TR10714/c0_g1_i1/m.63760/K14794/RRP12; ribosomal RNA-processing protein 12